MKNKIRLMVVLGVLMIGACFVLGEGLYVPNTDGDNLGRSDKEFGTAYVQTMAVSTSGVVDGDFVVTGGLIVTQTLDVGAATALGGALTVTGVSTNSTNVVVEGQLWLTLTADGGALITATMYTNLPNDVVVTHTNAPRWLRVSQSTNYYVVPAFQVGAP